MPLKGLMVTIYFVPPGNDMLCFGVFDGVLYSLLMCCGLLGFFDFYFGNFIIGGLVIIRLV